MPCNFSVLEACNSKRDRFIYSRIFWPNARATFNSKEHNTNNSCSLPIHLFQTLQHQYSFFFFIDFVYGRHFEHMCVGIFMCICIVFNVFPLNWSRFFYLLQTNDHKREFYLNRTHTVWLHFKQNSHMLMKTIILFTIMKTTKKIYWNVKSQTISFRLNKTLLNVCKPNFCLFTNQLFLNKNWNSVLTQQKTIYLISFFVCLNFASLQRK